MTETTKIEALTVNLIRIGGLNKKQAAHCANVALQTFAALASSTQPSAVEPIAEPGGYEQAHAIKEAYCTAAIEAYFKARPQLDTLACVRVFQAGFSRGYDAVTPPVVQEREVSGEILEGISSLLADVFSMPGMDSRSAPDYAVAVAYWLSTREKERLAVTPPPVAGDADGAKVARLMGLLDTLPDTTNLANRAVFKAALYQEFATPSKQEGA